MAAVRKLGSRTHRARLVWPDVNTASPSCRIHAEPFRHIHFHFGTLREIRLLSSGSVPAYSFGIPLCLLTYSRPDPERKVREIGSGLDQRKGLPGERQPYQDAAGFGDTGTGLTASTN